MTWTEIGALGEVLGAVAVVVSLVYLSRQVNQNTNAVHTQNASHVQANFQQAMRVFYQDREMGGIILRAMRGDEDLAAVDRAAAFAYFFDFLKTAELAHRQFISGELDRDLWEASLTFYRVYFSTKGFQHYWEERSEAFTPAFRNAMETWLAEPGSLKLPAALVEL